MNILLVQLILVIVAKLYQADFCVRQKSTKTLFLRFAANTQSGLVKKTERFVFLLFTFTAPFCTYAQNNSTVKGKVINKKGNSVPFSSIGFYKTTSLVRGTICDSLGNYTISIPPGKYLVRASAAGFDDYTKEWDVFKDEFIQIALTDSTKKLSEVVVTVRKPVIENKVDRTVFNVENSMFNKGVDGIELLRQAPGLIVTDNELVKLIGKDNVRVMIDGRLLNLSEEDVKQRIKSLRSDNIVRIEVIPIPPARYSAEGNSGMINIVLKKSPLLGWQGYINPAYIQRIYPSYSTAGGLNYKSNRFDIAIGANYDKMKVRNELYSDFSFIQNDQNISRYIIADNRILSFNNVIKYKLTSNMDIGATFDYNHRNTATNESEKILFRDHTKVEPDSIVNSFPFSHNKGETIAVTSFYDLRLDSGKKKMSLSYDYFITNSKMSKDVNAGIITSTSRTKNFFYNGNNDYSINNLALDYEAPYLFAMLEAGLRYTRISNISGLELYNLINNQPVFDSSVSNDFDYLEKTMAAYLSASKDISNKLSIKLGLRYEDTKVSGFSPTINSTNETKYSKLFPTLFVLHKLNSTNLISITYARRLNRPGFNDLNPFRYYTGAYSYTSGNAYLLPSFSQNIGLNYTYKNNLSTTLSLSRISNGVDYVVLFSANGVRSVMPENHLNQNRIGFTLSYTYRPFKWWNIYGSGILTYSEAKSFVPKLEVPPVSGFGAFGSLRSTFTLNKRQTTFWQISYNQFLPSQDGFSYTKAFGYLSTNLRFVMLQGKVQTMISALDIFRQNISITERNYKTYTSVTKSDARLQNIRLSITYTFGNKQVSAVQRASKNSDKDRAL